MPSSTSAREWPDAHDWRRQLALWTGLLAGPLVWLALLETHYVLSYLSCEVRQTWFLHLATIVSLVLVVAAGVGGWRAAAGNRQGAAARRDSPDPAAAESRVAWMGYAGAAMSAWFVIVILAMEVPILILPPCVRQ